MARTAVGGEEGARQAEYRRVAPSLTPAAYRKHRHRRATHAPVRSTPRIPTASVSARTAYTAPAADGQLAVVQCASPLLVPRDPRMRSPGGRAVLWPAVLQTLP